jgi:hypothetical protein
VSSGDGLKSGKQYRASIETVTRKLPVVVDSLPGGFDLEGVEPQEVSVCFKGRRRDLYLARSGSMAVQVE